MKSVLLIGITLLLWCAAVQAQTPAPYHRYAFGYQGVFPEAASVSSEPLSSVGVLTAGEGIANDPSGGLNVNSGGTPIIDLDEGVDFGAFTVSMWFKPDGQPRSQYMFWFDSRRSRGFGQGFFARYNMATASIEFGSTSGWNSIPWTLNTSGWTHIAFVYDFSNRMRQVYVNGHPLNATDPTFNSASHGTQMYVGNAITSEQLLYRLPATIDEVRVYGHVLTPGQIDQLYDTSAPSELTGITTTAADSNSVAITWSPSSDNRAVADYLVYNATTETAIVTGDPSLTLIGLDELTDYVLHIAARDAAGNTSGETQYTVKTTSSDVVPPSIPSNFRATYVDALEASFQFGVSTDNVGVRYYELTIGNQVLQTSVSYVYVRDLVRDSTYQVSLVAVDEAGNRSDAATLQVTTRAASVAAGLVHYWDFENGLLDDNWFGNVFSSGFNATAGKDRFSGAMDAMYFDGQGPLNDSDVEINFDQPLTVSAWVKVSDSSQTDQYIFDLLNSNNRGLAILYLPSAKQLNFAIVDGDDVSELKVSFTPEQDVWTHLAFTYNPITEARTVYVNGERVSSIDDWFFLLPAGTPARLAVGAPFSFRSFQFHGAVDDVRLCQGDVVTADIALMYAERDSIAPTQPELVTASDITATTARITWQPASDDERVEGYSLYTYQDLAATVDAQSRAHVITNLQPNTQYTIGVEAGDQHGNRSQRGTVSFTTAGASSTKVPSELAAFSLSPNPARTGNVQLQGLSRGTQVELIDALGRRTLTLPVEARTLEVSALAPGLYFVRAVTAKGATTTRRLSIE